MMNNGFNNFNNGYPGGYYGGMMYQSAPQLHMTQGVTPEQLKSLRKNSGGFNLNITEEELLRSYCAHRNENSFTTVQDDEGYFTCTLCGTKFKPFEGSVAEARELVDQMKNLLETTKMRAISLPGKTIQDVFQIEPILDRIPDLYSQSINDFKRAMGTTDNYIYGQENNGFAFYQNMLNPMAGTGYYDPSVNQQPVYGAQAPMYGQQQYGQPMMQQAPMYGQQMYGQQQYGQGYQPYDQQMNQQQVQGNPFNVNSAPVTGSAQQQQQNGAEKEVTVTKTLTD